MSSGIQASRSFRSPPCVLPSNLQEPALSLLAPAEMLVGWVEHPVRSKAAPTHPRDRSLAHPVLATDLPLQAGELLLVDPALRHVGGVIHANNKRLFQRDRHKLSGGHCDRGRFTPIRRIRERVLHQADYLNSPATSAEYCQHPTGITN